MKRDNIKELSIPPVAEEMIKELIDRKANEVKKENKMKRLTIIAVISFLFTVVYVMFFQTTISTSDPFLYLFHIWDDRFVQLPMLVGVVFLVSAMFTKKNLDKAEDEYDELREEFILRAEELFDKQNEWVHRHHLYAWLKEKYDINLYHK